MLSSTMLSVLGPHWSGRLRRNKRGVVTGEPGQDAQGNLREVTHSPNSEVNSVHQQFLETQRQHGRERWSRDRFQPQERCTVGWSTLSGPPSTNLNYPIKSPVVQSVSLDVDSGRLDNRGIDGDVLNLAAKFEPPISPLSLDLQAPSRISQAGHQGDQLSSSSSKPTTSSLLLSLRRLNSNLSPTHSETNPPSVTCLTKERAAKLSRTHPSPTSPNNNERERSNERMQTVLSPSSPNYRGDCFSASPNSKDPEGSRFSNLPQTTMKTYPAFSYPSKQTFLTSALSTQEKPNIDKTADPVTDASLPSPQPFHYDRLAFLKSQTLPRGTTLRSTSWWKQVTQEDSLPLRYNDTTTIDNKNDSSTVSIKPSNNNLASQNTNDNTSLSSQVSNRKNDNNVESFHPDNLNFSFKKKATAKTIRQGYAQDSPDPNSDTFLRLQNDFNLNEREPQKPQSLPSAFSMTKISSVAGQTAMSHTKDFSKPDDVSDRSYKHNQAETPLTFLPPNTSKASHSNPQTYHHVPQTGNNIPMSSNSFRPCYKFCPLSFNDSEARNPDSQSDLKSPSSIRTSQNTIETSVLTSENTPPSPAFYTPRSLRIPATNVKSSQNTSTYNQPLQTEIKPNLSLTKQSLSLDTTQAVSPKAFSSSCPLPQPKTPPFSGRQPLSPLNSRSCVSPSALTPHPRSPKVTNTITTTTAPQLLGFERTYIPISQSFHPKTLSTLSPTSALLSPKTKYGPMSTNSFPLTSSTTPCSTNASLPTSTTLSSSFLTPSISPAQTCSTTTMTTSSPLSPPATLNLARPLSPANSPPQGERTFTGSLDLSPKKQHSQVEGRKMTRVTWQDLVDQQGSEAASKSEESGLSQLSSQPPTSPLSPLRTPSIFSFLRVSSPTGTVSPLSPPTPKTSSIQMCKGWKNQSASLPSDPADQAPCKEGGRALTSGQESISRFTFYHGGADSTVAEAERKLSEEESAAQCGSSARLSLPPDIRYSSPPYSALKCAQSTRAEATTAAPTSPLSQQPSSPPKSLTALPLTLHPAPAANVTSPSKPPRSPITSPQPLSIPFQNKAGSQESSKFVAMDTNHVNNNNCKQSSQDGRNAQTSHVDMSLLLQSEKARSSPSARVSIVETLVYRIPKADSTAALDRAKPKPLLQQTPNIRVAMETKFKRQSHSEQSSEVIGNSRFWSQQSSYGSSYKENQCPSLERADDECTDRRMKETGVCRSRFFLSESKGEMPPLPSPKRGLFTLKKRDSVGSVASDSSTPDQAMQPSPDTTKSETDRSRRSGKKIDQVLSRLRQTFSAKRLDDDLVFPRRCKPPSQTPSVSGSSDVSDISNNTIDSNKTLEEEREQERIEVDRDSRTRKKERERLTGDRTGGGRFSSLEKMTTENDPNKDFVFELLQKDRGLFTQEQVTETESQSCLIRHSPTRHHIDFYSDKRAEYKPTNQSLPRDVSPARQQLLDPNRYATFPTHRRNSTASPRSPFSPFTFLSPFSPADAMDDSVFYSPELQRRKESTSPCESGDWFSRLDSGRTRASTGPSSEDPCQEKDCLSSYSSCADLKYGLEAGRSFSVSSVLSSRPSGPGRISTGSWVLSMSDLSDPALNFGEHSSGARDRDQWSVTSDRSSRNDCKSMDDYRVSTIPSDPGKMRSRSLPRSFARSLSTWGSEVTNLPPPKTTTSTITTTTIKPGRLWSPTSLDTTDFVWDAEDPPTPPPSPPWSPASRRMSKSPSLSSPGSPGSPGLPQDNQSPRGHLPSRGYVSSLTAFDETDSSDTSSDTTTDDEYYLEMEEGEDKETEL